MRRRTKIDTNRKSEFELDLAPLLSVMVKLVPVLIVSSAFFQSMIIETELPQVVQQAIKQQENNKKATQISLEVSKKDGVRIFVNSSEDSKVEVVQNVDSQIDLKTLHTKLIAIKSEHPEIFKIDLNPESDVAYDDLIKVMDEARRSRDNKIQFKFTDTTTGKEVSTGYMFPEIVFSNVMDG